MSGDREAVLARVRAAAGRRVPHPGVWEGAPGLTDFPAFARILAAVGGEAHGPLPERELPAALAAWADTRGAGRRVAAASAARRLCDPRWETLGEAVAPQALADVQVAVGVGCLGVAENGALAVLGRDVPNRALLFLAEHLALLLDVRGLVPDLHAAFRALPEGALAPPGLTWVSGPSKTADIEQTLVLGAHGPRELAVFLVGPARAPD